MIAETKDTHNVQRTVKVIGAGWSRSGTQSLQKAIEILGLGGPCYHMGEAWSHAHSSQWTKVADSIEGTTSTAATSDNLHSIFNTRGYAATCDYPSAVYWKQQLELYPDAKVILTYREPEEWYESMMKTIGKFLPDNPECPFGTRVAFAMGMPNHGAAEMLNKVITRDCFGDDWSKGNILRHYLKNVEIIKNEFADKPGKLLVFEPQMGWDPLCSFLGVPVPKQPFPPVDVTEEVQSELSKLDGMGIFLTCVGFGVPGLLRQMPITREMREQVDTGKGLKIVPSIPLHERLAPNLMLAAYYAEYDAPGAYTHLQIKLVPKPVARKGFAVVRVFSAALNPLDLKIFRGYVGRMGWRMSLPFIPGYELSGVIESLIYDDDDDTDDVDATKSSADRRLKVGDPVFGTNFGKKRHDDDFDCIAGCLAEYALIPICKLSKKPPNVSFEVAAGLSFSGTTAYQVCEDVIQASTGSRVLVLGGSSAVGMIAIQLLKMKGAWVATTCSTRNVEFVKGLGVDYIVNYEEAKWEDDTRFRGLDAVFDAVGPAGEIGGLAKAKSHNVVKDGGVYVSVTSFEPGHNPSAHPPLRFCAKYDVSGNTNHQDYLASLIECGKLRVYIDQTFHMTNAGIKQLYAKVESSKSTGKNILSICTK